MKILDNAMVRDRYDVVVVGGGIGGLTTAALLAKRGLKLLLVEQHYLPGGACSAIRRQGIAMDVGAALLFGFTERGYNPHRFVMNELEEEIDMIPHEALYRMHLGGGQSVTLWRDFERFFAELVAVFPHQEKGLRGLYRHLYKLYDSIVLQNDMPVPPTEMPMSESVKGFFRNPIGTMQIVRMMFQNGARLLGKYITDPKLMNLFDILLAIFTCTTVSETPAILVTTMFVDQHEGGACYPSGSPQTLPDKLEKAIEKFGGQVLYRHLVEEILIFKGKAYGVRLDDGTEILADRVVSNATVWNLYGDLVKPRHISPKRMKWAQNHVPTVPAFLLYLGVDAGAIPEGTSAIELYIEDFGDITSANNFVAYIPSLDDPTIAPPGMHSMTILRGDGEKWPRPFEPEYRSEEYKRRKEAQAEKMLDTVEKLWPGFRKHIKVMEIGTAGTIERFTLKNWGTIGGPKQMMGQEFFKRLKARSEWKNLYCCGDSTVMGEGVVATTASGVGAANMVLRDLGLKEYLPRKFRREFVNLIKGRPWTPPPEPSDPITDDTAKRIARECQHCEDPGCMKTCPAGIDVLNFARRIEAGNFPGAARSLREMNPLAEVCGYICPAERLCQKECNRKDFSDVPVRIADLHAWVCGRVSRLEGWDHSFPDSNGHCAAVIGTGPAGLTCAYFLARMGFGVTVYDKSQKPGGMLSRAIPAFRLPEEVVQRELDGMVHPGIEFRYGQELGKDFTVDELLKDNQAVFLAPGLWAGRKLDLPGIEHAEVNDALSFLAEFKDKGGCRVKGRLLVVGGGSVAADAALAAKQSGASKVAMVCLESEPEMPALPSEVAELKKQGVEVHNCWGPKDFMAATKLTFIRCTSVFDGDGNFCPAFDESQTRELEFDQVIMAVGQVAEPALAGYLPKAFGRGDLIEVDEDSMQVRDRPGVYAGGDIVRGAGTVVQAVADGRKAAWAIDRYISKNK